MSRPVVTAEVDGWGAVRAEVVHRDRACIFTPVGQLDRRDRPLAGIPDHFCRDRWSSPIPWWRIARIDPSGDSALFELDHVKEEPMMGQKAPDDSAHLVMACHLAHQGGLATSHEGREYERRWLAAFYPDVWATFLERRAG